jgi:predicted aconitase
VVFHFQDTGVAASPTVPFVQSLEDPSKQLGAALPGAQGSTALLQIAGVTDAECGPEDPCPDSPSQPSPTHSWYA